MEQVNSNLDRIKRLPSFDKQLPTEDSVRAAYESISSCSVTRETIAELDALRSRTMEL